MNDKILSRKLFKHTVGSCLYHMTRFVDYDIMTVGETPYTHKAEDIAAYVLPASKELNMVFHNQIMNLDDGWVDGRAETASILIHREWRLSELKNVVDKWQQYKREEGYWNTYVISYLP